MSCSTARGAKVMTTGLTWAGITLTVSCFSKIHLSFTFLRPAHLGSTGQRAVKRVLLLAVQCQLCSMNIFPVYGMEMVWYGDGAGNTVEENSSVFSLV